MILEASVLMINEELSVRSGMASTGASTKAAFNLSIEDYPASILTHPEYDSVRSVRGAAMSA